MAVCDRATVLRDGRLVGTVETAATSIDGLIRMMVGRDLGTFAPVQGGATRGAEPATDGAGPLDRHGSFRPQCHHGPRHLARCLSRRNPGHRGAGRCRPDRTGARHLRRRSDVRRYRVGRRQASGDRHAGRRHRARHRPRAGRPQAAGAVPVAGDPDATCPMASHRVLGQMVRHGLRRRRAARRGARRAVSARRSNIRMASPEQPDRQPVWRQSTEGRAGPLAGPASRRFLIVDEPTRGIDVAAKAEVHQSARAPGARRHRGRW